MPVDALGPFGADPQRAGVFLDFDGTLSDITEDPSDAVPRAGVPELLAALGQRLGRVVVVSGRPLRHLDPMLPAAVDIVGLYGLEWREDGGAHTLPEAEPWRTVVSAVADEAVSEFGAAVVEPKGLSLTIHYRNEPALEAPIRDWVNDRAARTGLDGRAAKRSFELHPPIPRDKGTVVAELADGLDPIAYAGDDLGDLPAFDALDVLARDGVTTLRIAVSSPEAPPVLMSRADVVVEGPAGAQVLLEQLLANVS